MVKFGFNKEYIKELNLDDSIKSTSVETLELVDIMTINTWIEKFNANVSEDRRISSSELLSYIALDEIIDEFISSTLEDDDLNEHLTELEGVENEYKDLIQYLQDNLKIPLKEQNTQDFYHQLITISAKSEFFNHSKQIKRIKNLSQLTILEQENGFNEFVKRISSIMENIIINDDASDGTTLRGLLLLPLIKFPDSMEDQFLEILEQWKHPEQYRKVILKTIDLIREQTKVRGEGGPGEVHLPHFEDFYPENYSEDREWMPKAVVLAKHTQVWLSQLSRKYEKDITRLDQIPDAELEEIVNRGFNAIWFIGLWKRSPASKKIKRRMGNPEAASSAYSVWDYVISDELGGHEAYYDLSERAGKLGLRLASDMVPNHTGILSKWVIEHPDWFIQTSEPPFPSYKFESEDLSDHPHVNIYLEDHYYDHSDAAVVFKRYDSENDDVRYIYHGNDGTAIPWNDTAQLDFLKEEVREAVINLIIHVAKMFPIIRLDAAMILTKKHFQRLWYPSPGAGGDIPSRSWFGLSHEEFNRLFPKEFWSEVINRIEKEAPNTLLVAEAFWMLEGYFVRTLGVHRVYNSAFMHMLRDQKNEEYRGMIKSTLEYDPRILQRYVNFMSNPDEETAIEQFGNSDKYFGVAVMMSTLPGMPMIAHGQIEGFTEKYGMEYSTDYWKEDIDKDLLRNHENLIFPLLRKR